MINFWPEKKNETFFRLSQGTRHFPRVGFLLQQPLCVGKCKLLGACHNSSKPSRPDLGQFKLSRNGRNAFPPKVIKSVQNNQSKTISPKQSSHCRPPDFPPRLPPQRQRCQLYPLGLGVLRQCQSCKHHVRRCSYPPQEMVTVVTGRREMVVAVITRGD